MFFSHLSPAGARARRGFWLTLFGGCGPQIFGHGGPQKETIVLKNPPGFQGRKKLLFFGVWEITVPNIIMGDMDTHMLIMSNIL